MPDIFIPGSQVTSEAYLLTGAVQSYHIDDAQVTAPALGTASVQTRHIGEGQLSSSHFSDGFTSGYTEHKLNAATISALFATPKTLIAAPGSGSYIDWRGSTLYFDMDNAAFTDIANSGDIVFFIGQNAAGHEMKEAGRCLSAGLLDQSASVIAHCQPMAVSGSVSSYNVAENEPLQITLKAAGISGGGKSTLAIRSYYRILTGSWLND